MPCELSNTWFKIKLLNQAKIMSVAKFFSSITSVPKPPVYLVAQFLTMVMPQVPFTGATLGWLVGWSFLKHQLERVQLPQSSALHSSFTLFSLENYWSLRFNKIFVEHCISCLKLVVISITNTLKRTLYSSSIYQILIFFVKLISSIVAETTYILFPFESAILSKIAKT